MANHEQDGATAAEINDSGAVFECPICAFTGKTKSKIEKHMTCRDHDEEDSTFLCGDCPFQCMNRDQLLEHLETKHEKHICNTCNIACKSKTFLNKHILESHQSYKPCRDYATNTCDYKSGCRFRHIKLKKDEYICYTCGLRIQTLRDLMAHIKEIHGSQACTKFAKGQCDRGSRCLYSHSKTRGHKVNHSTPTERQGDVLEDEEEVFQESPKRSRRPYSQVAAANSSHQERVYNVSGGTQHQKVVEVTQAALTQMMPILVQKILESMQQTN